MNENGFIFVQLADYFGFKIVATPDFHRT